MMRVYHFGRDRGVDVGFLGRVVGLVFRSQGRSVHCLEQRGCTGPLAFLFYSEEMPGVRAMDKGEEAIMVAPTHGGGAIVFLVGCSSVPLGGVEVRV